MSQPIPAEIVFAITGVISASFYVIPYSLVGELTSREDTGRYCGLLNTTQVSAQITANFLASIAIQVTGSVTYGIGMFSQFLILLFSDISQLLEVFWQLSLRWERGDLSQNCQSPTLPLKMRRNGRFCLSTKINLYKEVFT